MLIKRNYEEERRIASYDIIGLTRADMYELTQVYDEVNKVIINHLTEDKKLYISDETLIRVLAILDVLTENNRTTLMKSEFEKRRETLLKSHDIIKKTASKECPDDFNKKALAI